MITTTFYEINKRERATAEIIRGGKQIESFHVFVVCAREEREGGGGGERETVHRERERENRESGVWSFFFFLCRVPKLFCFLFFLPLF